MELAFEKRGLERIWQTSWSWERTLWDARCANADVGKTPVHERAALVWCADRHETDKKV